MCLQAGTTSRVADERSGNLPVAGANAAAPTTQVLEVLDPGRGDNQMGTGGGFLQITEPAEIADQTVDFDVPEAEILAQTVRIEAHRGVVLRQRIGVLQDNETFPLHPPECLALRPGLLSLSWASQWLSYGGSIVHQQMVVAQLAVPPVAVTVPACPMASGIGSCT